MMTISLMHQREYVRYVRSKMPFDLYMNILLTISVKMAIPTNTRVNMNIVESPNPNHAVSEKGIDIFRYTRANNTENVTVPIR